ncbi:short-chain dehydrogenase [Streptomyces subrutilus]|uniref:SDR family NAD(P)-dependent oxidoreductase n=1 Tax=Streptomyces subrutilus TaxID=36818 RepID=A0A5P2UER6_9ACTN|nr:SDR family NAD(P)-dependent oxidoreductase [Streptomyces subrutilus]QEU77743.1 SDR family NAD(P)-dependent oxidoreductase [Streptomyces subrutilus]GGZ61781.1 short-chain dehydrogenase [Streptomyces subrutilus]
MPTALVSGVSRGLGAHLCRALRAAGHRVLGVGLSPSPGGDHVDDYRALDLREPLADDLFAAEDVDVLVNNAGVYLDDPRGGYGDLFSLTPDDLRDTFEVNLFGTARLVQRYAPRMLARGSGRIVCVSSGMGRLQDADGASFAYRSSKLAANSLVLSVARHFAEASGDLAAFAYCPGWIRTDMGTPDAPNEPAPAAGDLVRLLGVPAGRSNGRFFRGLDELGWDTRGPMVADAD